MYEGKRVQLTLNGVTVEAWVVIGSDNRKSLLFAWSPASALHTSTGGIYIGSLAVLWSDERKRYEEIIEGDEVTLAWPENLLL